MSLTEILLIILTTSAVVAVVFWVLLVFRLRRTAAEAEKTLVDARGLIKNLNELDFAIKDRVDELGETLQVGRKAAAGLSEAAMLVTSKLLPVPTKYLPFLIPVVRFVMKQMKKKKESIDVEGE